MYVEEYVYSVYKSTVQSIAFALTIIVCGIIVSIIKLFNLDFYMIGYKGLEIIVTTMVTFSTAIIGIMFIKLIVWIKEIFEW